MESFSIRIESLAYGGSGVGRKDGIVHFIPFTCPGDLVEAAVTRCGKNYREAVLLDLIEASPDRTTPVCPHFGKCGGCQWQHVSYKRQLIEKQSGLSAELKKNGIIPSGSGDGVITHDIIASPNEYGYRRMARLKTGLDEAGRPSAGFFEAGTNKLIPVKNCPLLEDELNKALFELEPPSAGIEGLDLYMDEEGRAVQVPRKSIGDPGADFIQVNRSVNSAVREKVKEAVLENKYPGGKPSIADLYCGDGNMSLMFAEHAGKIRGWDYSAGAVSRAAAAAVSLREKGFTADMHYSRADLTREWSSVSKSVRGFDCLILDPPRSGLKKDALKVAAFKIPLVIYISCAPPALARDLAAFRKAGYTVDRIIPFDMFPQTYHLETLAVLKLCHPV